MANYEKVRKGLLLDLLPKASPTGLPERRTENVAVDHMASLKVAAITTDSAVLIMNKIKVDGIDGTRYMSAEDKGGLG